MAEEADASPPRATDEPPPATDEPRPPRAFLAGRSAASLFLVLLAAVVVVIGLARRKTLSWLSEPAAVSAPPPGEPAPAALATATPEGAQERASCSLPERGSGPYGAWEKLPLGMISVPAPAPSDEYDLLLHLHGGDAMHQVVAPEAFPGLVLAAVDAGVGSRAYEEALAGDALEQILGAVAESLRPARLRHLILSSWSAGYGGVRTLLRRHPTVANAVILLDSVHTGYAADGETLLAEDLAPFISLAHRGRLKEGVVVLTHSDIRPPGYASTTEVADAIIGTLDGSRRYGGLVPTFGVELKTRFDAGHFHLRGYSGADEGAHCVHLRMLAPILRDEVLPALAAGKQATSTGGPQPEP